MSSEDIATALLRKALDHKGISYWPNKESPHNADLYDNVVYVVEDYNKLFPERLTPDFISWYAGEGVISVTGTLLQIGSAYKVLAYVNKFLREYKVD